MDAGYSKTKCLPPPRSFKLRLSAIFAAGRGRNSEQEGTRKSAEQAVALLVAVK